MIELKRLSKFYTHLDPPLCALDDINLTIARGEIFGIVGESGAGKSTLIRTINLLEKPTSGEVWIDGVEMTTLSAKQLRNKRRHIGMIFQHFNLLESRTAYENIALPLELVGESKKKINSMVQSLLSLVHLEHHANHYPHQLSGGQKQRVAIARALATQPNILLCDEVTSALDPKSTHSVLNLLKEIHQKLNVTIVLITHEMNVIKSLCHRACILDHGKLIESGNVVDLFSRPKENLTRQFIQKSLHIELPFTIKQKLQQEVGNNKSRLVRFTFIGDDSSEPLLTTLVKKFDITINIIQANIESIQEVTVGFTVCQLNGDPVQIDQALASLSPTSVTVEVIGYV